MLSFILTLVLQSLLASDKVGAKYSYSSTTTSDVSRRVPSDTNPSKNIDEHRGSDPGFGDMLARYKLDLRALCPSLNGWYQGILRTYWLIIVECDIKSGNPRQIKITCGSQFQAHFHGITTRSANKYFHPLCPEGTVCQAVYRINQKGQGPDEEIGCADEEDVVEETVSTGRSEPPVHCSLTLAIPSSQSRAALGQKTFDVVLTEQVTYPNGTAYIAPLLYIRDMSNPNGWDRTLRRDASVASAVIQVGTYRDNFVTKEFKFCVQMLPGHLVSSILFTYSYFQVTMRHGTISQEPSRQLDGPAKAGYEAQRRVAT